VTAVEGHGREIEGVWLCVSVCVSECVNRARVVFGLASFLRVLCVCDRLPASVWLLPCVGPGGQWDGHLRGSGGAGRLPQPVHHRQHRPHAATGGQRGEGTVCAASALTAPLLLWLRL
jgi:hypothetical protein